MAFYWMNNSLSTGRIWVGHGCCWPSPCVQLRQSSRVIEYEPSWHFHTSRRRTLVNVSRGYLKPKLKRWCTWAASQTQEADREKASGKRKNRLSSKIEAFRSLMQWFAPIALQCQRVKRSVCLAEPFWQPVMWMLACSQPGSYHLDGWRLPPRRMETGQNESNTGSVSVGIVVRFFNLSFFQILRSNIFFLFFIYIYIHIHVLKA